MIHRRNAGDGFVTCSCGQAHWGLFGAAGLLLATEDQVLLQHRAKWSHHGGTWGIPGGALRPGETPLAGALREAWEEAGIPAAQVQARFGHILAHEGWSYTTVVASANEAVTPAPHDAESIEVRWVPQDEVEHLNLLPEFAASWPLLRQWLGRQLWWSRPEPVPDAMSTADLARYVGLDATPWAAEVGIWYPTPARGADSAKLRADRPGDVVI